MNEAQTRLNLIDPAIRAAGWTAENDCQVLVEQTVAPGRVGKVRGKPLRADYILSYRGRRLVVVEAKGDEHQAIEGYEQALKYGRMLGVQVAYATNGREILEIDLATGGANPVSEFPAPQELWSFMGIRFQRRGSHGQRKWRYGKHMQGQALCREPLVRNRN